MALVTRAAVRNTLGKNEKQPWGFCDVPLGLVSPFSLVYMSVNSKRRAKVLGFLKVWAAFFWGP